MRSALLINGKQSGSTNDRAEQFAARERARAFRQSRAHAISGGYVFDIGE
jgi:hypothetical protein